MSRATQFVQLIEEILNPDHGYNDAHFTVNKYDKKHTYYKSDDDFVKPTHDVLKAEADKALSPKGEKTKRYLALKHYAGSGYKNMNSLLRTGTSKMDVTDPSYGDEPTNQAHIKNLKALTKNPTKHEFYAYRGINVKDAGLKIRAGSVIHDKGFTSVSLRPQTATYFGKSNQKSKDERNFRVHVTPGTRGHYASHHEKIGGKNYVGEAEFILHPGTKFKVGKTHVDLADQKFTDLHIHSQED